MPAPATATVERRVRRTLEEIRRAEVNPAPGGTVTAGRSLLVACSGGADSVLLAWAMATLARPHSPASVDLLWLDHGLRDGAADRAAATALAARFRLPLHERAATHLAGRGDLMARARQWRYAMLADVATAIGADVICTGHHASDSLESSLHGLLSSGSLAAAAGVPAWVPAGSRPVPWPQVDVLRPLRGLDRATIRTAADELGLDYVDDPTNADVTRPRAHLRHTVVPALAATHPGAAENLERAAVSSAEADTAIRALARAWLTAHEAPPNGLPTHPLVALPGAARRAVVAEWLRTCGLGRRLTRSAVEQVLELTGSRSARNNPAHARAELAGADVVVDGDTIVFEPRRPAAPAGHTASHRQRTPEAPRR